MNYGILPTYRGPVVADPAWAVAFARTAEAAGCDSIWTVEHMVVPDDYGSRYPYAPGGRMPLSGTDPIPDPLDWLAFVAGATTTVKLGTCIIILPEHNPVQLAKRLATIDVLSGGRLIVGVGVGWLREEAEAVGAVFEERGARTDEYLDVLRTLWRDDVASFAGQFVRFSGVRSVPKPLRHGGVPVVVGGHSRSAAVRAGRRGDGFYPLGVRPTELAELLGAMRAAARAAGRDPDAIEVTTSAPADLDQARRYADLGVSRFILSAPPDGDLDRMRQRIGEFADTIIAGLG